MHEHTWSMTMSNKPRRKGEVFIKRGDKFVMKLYKDGVDDPVRLGRYLCTQLNRLEAVKAARELSAPVPAGVNMVCTSGMQNPLNFDQQDRRYTVVKE